MGSLLCRQAQAFATWDLSARHANEMVWITVTVVAANVDTNGGRVRAAVEVCVGGIPVIVVGTVTSLVLVLVLVLVEVEVEVKAEEVVIGTGNGLSGGSVGGGANRQGDQGQNKL